MKIASIDIGTNAIKSKIFNTSPTSIEFIDGVRTPIRLGSDVFKDGHLSETILEELVNALLNYQEEFEKNNIKMYEIVATSAFRDSENSEKARRYVENKINHPIRIISGLEEAKLIRFHPRAQDSKNRIYVDVGGGSTELYIFQNKKHIIQSFQLGAVRNMTRSDTKDEWDRLSKWLVNQKNITTLMGLGGNIRTFLNINNTKKMSSKQFIENLNQLKLKDVQEKIDLYNFAMDRADVIDYALDIYKLIVNKLGIKKIRATKWGVSDSIAVKTFHELYSKKITIYQD